MKRNLLLVLPLMLLILSCSTKSDQDRYVQEVINTMHGSMKAKAKLPETASFSNERIVFNQDSLCIVHVDFSANNVFGTLLTKSRQYIGYTQDGVYYEFFDDIEDSVFVAKEKYDQIKKGTFYENLPYEDGIKFRCIQRLNKEGWILGNESAKVQLCNSLGTGMWDLFRKKDSFGEYTDCTYIELAGFGTFSNSATTDSKLKVNLIVDAQSMYMILFEYGNFPKKDKWSGNMKVKAQDGNILTFQVRNTEEGTLQIVDSKGSFAQIVNNEGKILCNIDSEKYPYGTIFKNPYTWSFDLDGYNRAKQFIK